MNANSQFRFIVDTKAILQNCAHYYVRNYFSLYSACEKSFKQKVTGSLFCDIHNVFIHKKTNIVRFQLYVNCSDTNQN
jgi:hypothetical protein